METDDLQQTNRRKKLELKEVIDVPRSTVCILHMKSIRILHEIKSCKKSKRTTKVIHNKTKVRKIKIEYDRIKIKFAMKQIKWKHFQKHK